MQVPEFQRLLFTTYVRPILEYASPVWNPTEKGLTLALERVQRRFTKRIPLLRHLSYPMRLESLKLATLEHRRRIIDLCTLFRITKGFLSTSPAICIEHHASTARGHPLKLRNPPGTTPSPFIQRVLRPWNRLPADVVTTENPKTFKTLLLKLDLEALYSPISTKHRRPAQPTTPDGPKAQAQRPKTYVKRPKKYVKTKDLCDAAPDL